VAVLMRFTWTFLPTVTIDLTVEKASGMPLVIERKRPIRWAFSRPATARTGACGGHTVLDGCLGLR
jgi:hypothetical protein